LNPEAMRTLTAGTIPLEHPQNVRFRARNKAEEIHKHDVYLRNYTVAKERAESTCKEFRNGHLEQTPFLENRYFLEKVRVAEKEMGAPMRYGIRTENERLAKELNGTNRLIDPSEKDTTMLFHPSWKNVEKRKWTAKNDFDLTTCYYRGKRSADPWKQIQVGINIGDSYSDGFEVVGDTSRKRRKHQEIVPKDFVTTVVPNHSSHTYMPPLDSTSIRASKSHKFLTTSRMSSTKTYPKTLEHTIHYNNDGFDDSEPISRVASQAKPIQIKAGSSLDPLKESMISATYTRGRSEMSPKNEKSRLKTSMSSSIRKNKNAPLLTTNQIITNTVRIYFD